MFLTDLNSKDIVAVKLYLRGKPHIITIDTYVWMEYGVSYMHPKFASVYRSHTWAPMLEKAWAKMIGNYDAA